MEKFYKRHTQFRNKEGGLFWEELISRDTLWCNLFLFFHKNLQHPLKKSVNLNFSKIKSNFDIHRHYHIKTEKIKLSGNAIKSRYPLFYNSDLIIYKSHIDQSMN